MLVCSIQISPTTELGWLGCGGTPRVLGGSGGRTSEEILQLPAPAPDERIAYGNDPLQFGELRLPPGTGPHPVALVIHGGFWRSKYTLAHIGHMCASLSEAGLATWSLAYRKIGDPGGAWTGTFDDVAAGADFVRQIGRTHPVDSDRVVAVGHSSGGHLALWLGCRAGLPANSSFGSGEPLRLRGVVSLAGVADLKRACELELSNKAVAELMGGTPDQVPDRYEMASPIERVPLGIPQIAIHGTADVDVPLEISERYVSAARACGDDARLIAIAGAGHYELIDPRTEAWQRVAGAIQDLLN